jgi:hypothetical protein
VVDPVEDAVLDNAAWCDAVCRAAGLPTRWSDDVWSVARRSPVGYPDAVTLRRGLAARAVLSEVEDGDDCSVKDSFADLDLHPAGFEVLFEASWIRRGATTAPAPPRLSWTEVRTGEDLAAWCRQLDVPPLPAALLEQGDRQVMTAADAGAGFVLSRCGAVVGITHAVPGLADPVDLWTDLVGLAARLHPGADLVGYEHGSDLEHARSAGFTVVGPLRVWLR